ncbi:hypothetical protein HN51_036240 [Arachis hypogaea]
MTSSTGSESGQRSYHKLVIFPNSRRRAATFNLPPCCIKSATDSTTRRDVSSFSVVRCSSSFTTLVSDRTLL